MQFSDYYFGGEPPPREFSDFRVNGRPVPLSAIVPSLIVLGVLLLQLTEGMNFVTIFLLLFIGRNCYAMLAAFFRPPQMAVRNGQFSLRFGQTTILCPAGNVADVRQEEQAVHVSLGDISRVEPAAVRQRMAAGPGGSSARVTIPAGIYTLEQVNQLRRALGLPEQAADAAGQRLAEFQSSVTAHWPLATTTLIIACAIVYLVKAYYDKSLAGGDTESSIAWGAN